MTNGNNSICDTGILPTKTVRADTKRPKEVDQRKHDLVPCLPSPQSFERHGEHSQQFRRRVVRGVSENIVLQEK